MYTWEIDDTMKSYNYRLPSSIYINICDSSPQIIFIERLNDSEFKIVAKEKDGSIREWVFSVFCDTNKC